MTPKAIAQRKANETPITSDLTVDQPTETPADATGDTRFDLARQQIDAKFERMKQQKLEALKGRLAAMGLSGGGIELEQMRQAEAEMDAQKGAEISAITQQELEQGFKAGESAMDRALTKMGLTLQEKQLANQASQFKDEMSFKTWAEQNNVDANTAARAWDQQKTAMGIASQEGMQAVGIKGQQDLATLQSNLGVAADMQKTQNELMVNTWFGIGQSGQALTPEQQAILDSNPAAKLAYEGGKAGKSLADIKSAQELRDKYINGRIENLGAMKDAGGNPISGEAFIVQLDAIYKELGIDRKTGAPISSITELPPEGEVIPEQSTTDYSKTVWQEPLSTPDGRQVNVMTYKTQGAYPNKNVLTDSQVEIINTARSNLKNGVLKPYIYPDEQSLFKTTQQLNPGAIIQIGSDTNNVWTVVGEASNIMTLYNVNTGDKLNYQKGFDLSTMRT